MLQWRLSTSLWECKPSRLGRGWRRCSPDKDSNRRGARRCPGVTSRSSNSALVRMSLAASQPSLVLFWPLTFQSPFPLCEGLLKKFHFQLLSISRVNYVQNEKKQKYLPSRISSCRFASPRAEKRSSFIRVSALRLFSRWLFLSCNALNAPSNISLSPCLSLQRDISFSSNMHLYGKK